ncbi:nucleotidyltransferase family protein [soil metagenome]
MQTVEVVGVLLAAGSGSRMGEPKALVTDALGVPWLTRSVDALYEGGCARVIVVLGAAAAEAIALIEDHSPATRTIVAHDWQTGMSASLRCGLVAAADDPADVALVHLVDLPTVGPAVVARLVAAAQASPVPSAYLARAVHGPRPGHPVAIGRDHGRNLSATLTGDSGGKMYLDAHDVSLIECSDLSDGHDVDSIVT